MSETILRIKNLAKSFADNQVHKDISFELYKGETLGLLGNSGTGKSVLLRSLIGLEFIDQGSIYFKDQRIDNYTEEQFLKLRTQVAYSFQNGALFDSINVFENLAYPLFEHTTLTFKEISKRIEDLLQLIGLKGKSHLMPSDLSGGMQKRVGIARSIILDPEVVLYDEPTAGLDPVNVDNILSIMQKLRAEKNISSIFVTHDIPAAIKVCDRIIILDKGRVAFSGSTLDLQNSDNSVVKRFFIKHEQEQMGLDNETT